MKKEIYFAVFFVFVLFFSMFFLHTAYLVKDALPIFYKLIFPFSVISSVLIINVLMFKNNKANHSFFSFLKRNIGFNILVLLLIAFSILFSSFVFDRSWDGQAYHQPTVIYLKQGWNPLLSFHSTDNSVVTDLINHYPHGVESLESVVYAFTTNLESAKAINFLLIFIAFFLCKAALDIFATKISNIKRIMYAVFFTLSPVVVVQITSFYIDGLWYLLLMSIISMFVLLGSQKSFLNFVILGMLITLIIPIKINAFFFCGLALLIYIIWQFFLKDYNHLKNVFLTVVISSLIGFCLFGFHPYVTNTIEHKHPFYPLINPNGKALDIMSMNTPLQFLGHGRFHNAFFSYFSLDKNNETGLYRYIWQIVDVDMRIGGFGPMFGLILISSLILLFLQVKKKVHISMSTIIVLCSLPLCVFIFREGWWARYVPFFWVFPLLILLNWDLNSTENHKKRYFVCFFFCLILFNGFKTANLFKISFDYTRYIKKELDGIKEDKRLVLIDYGVNYGFEEKFKSAGVNYTKVNICRYPKESKEFNVIGNLPYPFSPKWKFITK